VNDSVTDNSASAEQVSTTEQSSTEAFTGYPVLFWPATWRARIIFTPAAAAIFLVRSYQKILSPVLGRVCRFHPSCSQYYILAVRKYGLLLGSWRGLCRIARCHPWHPGGYDPP
jgi:uncharacterized protein